MRLTGLRQARGVLEDHGDALATPLMRARWACVAAPATDPSRRASRPNADMRAMAGSRPSTASQVTLLPAARSRRPCPTTSPGWQSPDSMPSTAPANPVRVPASKSTVRPVHLDDEARLAASGAQFSRSAEVVDRGNPCTEGRRGLPVDILALGRRRSRFWCSTVIGRIIDALQISQHAAEDGAACARGRRLVSSSFAERQLVELRVGPLADLLLLAAADRAG